MWTAKNRGRCGRGKLRYPGDPTGGGWELILPLIVPGKRGGGKRTVAMRAAVNGRMGILPAGLSVASDPGGPAASAGHSTWLRQGEPLAGFAEEHASHAYFGLWACGGTF
ncbi:MAG: hypothetical protein ACREDA_08125 [Methylocella sp.]